MSSPGRSKAPQVIIVAGPNGAGKSTTAPVLLSNTAPMKNYINPDLIARGLAPHDPASVAFAAGRIMHNRIRELADAGESFSFETTLAGRTYANLLIELASRGYETHIIFLWLNNVELAVERVAERVRYGGHRIPEHDIRRRYDLGIRNLLTVYRPLIKSWRIYDNSKPGGPELVAEEVTGRLEVTKGEVWNELLRDLKTHES